MRDILKFHANVIGTLEENEVFTLGFSEDDSFENYVNLSYQIEPLSEEERNWGWTNYYIEIGFNGNGGYGLISKAELTKGWITFFLNEKGKEELNIEKIEISFDEKDYGELIKSSLIRIFQIEEILNIC